MLTILHTDKGAPKYSLHENADIVLDNVKSFGKHLENGLPCITFSFGPQSYATWKFELDKERDLAFEAIRKQMNVVIV